MLFLSSISRCVDEWLHVMIYQISDRCAYSHVNAGPCAAQAARCLKSCRAVAVALRCNLPSAMLACTVYAAAPPGAEAGLQRSLAAHSLTSAAQCLNAFLSDDQRGFASQDSAIADAAAGWVGSCSLGAAQGDAGSSSEEGEQDAPSLLGDDYLRLPHSRMRLAPPLLTYVAVPALPRGAQVEFQPVALRSSRASALHLSGLPGMSVNCMHMVILAKAPHKAVQERQTAL